MKKILITGAAGFIGYHLAKELLERNFEILGVDNINDYYDRKLKFDRVKMLEPYDNFNFIEANISDKNQITEIFNNLNQKK